MITLEPVSDDEQTASLLEVAVGTPLVNLERLRCGAGQPLALMENWLHGEAAESLTTSELERHGLYELLRRHLVRRGPPPPPVTCSCSAGVHLA